MVEPKKNTPSAAYLWLDTEFTSLDFEAASLLEVAVVITNNKLELISPEVFHYYVKLEDSARISPWVREHLATTINKCLSPSALPITAIDQALASYIERWLGPPATEVASRPVLAGNSLQSDWLLARRFLPSLLGRIHYRFLDVTALKLQWFDYFGGPEFDKENRGLVQQFLPIATISPEMKEHDALFDVWASIAELNYYRQGLRKK